METATPEKLTDFQTKVQFYYKIEKTMQKTKNFMSAKIIWRSLKTLLELRDIFEYKESIQQCPYIAEYIEFPPGIQQQETVLMLDCTNALLMMILNWISPCCLLALCLLTPRLQQVQNHTSSILLITRFSV